MDKKSTKQVEKELHRSFSACSITEKEKLGYKSFKRVLSTLYEDELNMHFDQLDPDKDGMITRKAFSSFYLDKLEERG